MPLFFWQFVAIVFGYLLGSVSFAVLVSRVLGLQDPRSYGSGNPGATNVLRSGSKAAAIAVLPGSSDSYTCSGLHISLHTTPTSRQAL